MSRLLLFYAIWFLWFCTSAKAQTGNCENLRDKYLHVVAQNDTAWNEMQALENYILCSGNADWLYDLLLYYHTYNLEERFTAIAAITTLDKADQIAMVAFHYEQTGRADSAIYLYTSLFNQYHDALYPYQIAIIKYNQGHYVQALNWLDTAEVVIQNDNQQLYVNFFVPFALERHSVVKLPFQGAVWRLKAYVFSQLGNKDASSKYNRLAYGLSQIH